MPDIEAAIANGVLDPGIVEALPSTDEVASIEREPSPPGTRLGSDAIVAFRDDEASRR